MEVGGVQPAALPLGAQPRLSRPRAALGQEPSAAALPPPAQRRTPAARTPTKAFPGSNITVATRALWHSCGRLRVPSPDAKTYTHTHTHTQAQTHSSLFNRDAKTSPSRCSPEPGRSRLAQRPLAHLIQAVDFLGGIHDFPAAGALGVHCRGSRGRRLGGGGGGWGLRGAAVTSPGEPRTASGQAGGRRAAGRGAGGERAARRAGRRRRRGWVRSGAWRRGGRPRSRARARLRLGLRASRSAPLALQVPVTHTDTRSRPSRSLAPPPRRRGAGQTHRRAPTEVAGNEHVGPRGRAGEARVGGGRTPGKLRRQRAPEAWERASGRCRSRGGQVGGGGGLGDNAGRGGLKPAHSLPPISPLCGPSRYPTPTPRQTDVLGAQRSRGAGGGGTPTLLLQPRVAGGGAGTPGAAPSPWAEDGPGARSDALRPGSPETCGEPGDSRPRSALRCAAPVPKGLLPEKAFPACRVKSSDPGWGPHWLPTTALFISILEERLVILDPNQVFPD